MPRPRGKMILQEYDIPLTLLTTTRKLVRNDKRSLLLISQATGIPFYWLKKFSAHEIPNPAVNRVQFLYEFLTKSKLL